MYNEDLHSMYVLTKEYYGDQIQADELGGTYSMQGTDEQCFLMHCSNCGLYHYDRKNIDDWIHAFSVKSGTIRSVTKELL